MSTPENPQTAAVPTAAAPALPQTAMVVRQSSAALDRYGYEPESRAEAWKLAQSIVNTPFCPKGLVNAESVTLVLILGRELGFTTMQSLRHLYVVNGRPAISTAAKTALVQQSPECEFLRPVTLTSEKAVFETKRKGHSSPVTLEWTMNDAKAAGLATKPGPWREYPRKMLAWRCQSDLCDLVYPDLVSGLTTAEEAQDIPPERDLGRARRETANMILPGDDAPPEASGASEAHDKTESASPVVQTANDASEGSVAPPESKAFKVCRAAIEVAGVNDAAMLAAKGRLTEAIRGQKIDLEEMRSLFTMMLARAKVRASVDMAASITIELSDNVPEDMIAEMQQEAAQAKELRTK